MTPTFLLFLAILTLPTRAFFKYSYKKFITPIFSVRILKVPKYISFIEESAIAICAIMFSSIILKYNGSPDFLSGTTNLMALVIFFGLIPKVVWMFYVGLIGEFRKF